MRDRETVETGPAAAETGHLVLKYDTLHTIDAGQTINRILGMFEPEEQEQIRIRLADTLRWVISQRLAPKVGGGRYALLEMMGANLRTKETIVQGETEGKSFYEIIEANHTFGWRNFDQACLEALRPQQDHRGSRRPPIALRKKLSLEQSTRSKRARGEHIVAL